MSHAADQPTPGLRAWARLAPELRRRVYWLAGSPCAGKSSVAERLVAELDWRLYRCDDFFGDHRERSDPQRQPTFYQVSRLQGDALWLRPVVEQIRTEIPFCQEEFDLVLEDVCARMGEGDERPLLFEGTPALPAQLAPLLPAKNHAFYLIPTEPFQREHYARRAWVPDILATTSAPEQAFDNWMGRDAGFARWLRTAVVGEGLTWLEVDGSLSLEATVDKVRSHFHMV